VQITRTWLAVGEGVGPQEKKGGERPWFWVNRRTNGYARVYGSSNGPTKFEGSSWKEARHRKS